MVGEWTCLLYTSSKIPFLSFNAPVNEPALWPNISLSNSSLLKEEQDVYKRQAPTACRRMVSGTISLFYSKCFSPFLHSTGSLSVSREYLALPDGPGWFTQDSSGPALLRIPLRVVQLRIPDYHRLWFPFPKNSSHWMSCDNVVLQPQYCLNNIGLG